MRRVQTLGGDGGADGSHNVNMSRAPEHDWYLHEWVATSEKNQNSLTTELGMHKNTAHRLWHGKQPYRRDYVNQIAAWLNIQPYELLLHPEDAMAIRAMRAAAPRMVGSTAISQSPVRETEQPTEAPSRRKAS